MSPQLLQLYVNLVHSMNIISLNTQIPQPPEYTSTDTISVYYIPLMMGENSLNTHSQIPAKKTNYNFKKRIVSRNPLKLSLAPKLREIYPFVTCRHTKPHLHKVNSPPPVIMISA